LVDELMAGSICAFPDHAGSGLSWEGVEPASQQTFPEVSQQLRKQY